MKSIRTFLLWVHLALGLTGAVVIAILAVTGAYITFQDPLERWLMPTPQVSGVPQSPDVASIVAAVESRFAPERVAQLEVRRNGDATLVLLRNRTLVFVDPSDATILGSRESALFSLATMTRVMRVAHTSLALGPRGGFLVEVATLECVLLAATGLWLWWRRKHWRFAWKGSAFRISWDLHNATGVWFLIPVLAITVTGLLLPYPGIVYRALGETPTQWLPPPQSAPMEGAVIVSLATALATADSALPGPVEGLTIPAGSRGAIGVRKATHTAFVDRHSGSLLEVQRTNAEDAVFVQIEHAHTGETFGVTGRAVWTIASLMLAVMAVTGVILGIKRLMITFGRWQSDD